MTVARALAVLTALGTAAAAPVAAQMPNGIVGGTNLLEAARTPIPTGTPTSSDRSTAPGTRAMGGAGTITLGDVSTSPGGTRTRPDASAEAGVPVAVAAPAASLTEPGAPIRVRRTQIVAGEAVRATAGTAASPGGRPIGPGAPIVIPGSGAASRSASGS